MEKNHYKVLILIKHGLYEPFITLASEGQGETFLKLDHGKDIRVIHYYGIPTGKAIQKLGGFHENIRWKNRYTNFLLRLFDYTILSAFLYWIPKVKPSECLNLPDDEFECGVVDTLPTLRWKQLAIYKHVLENYNFDYVYDTNESSYLDYKNLLQVLDRFNKSPLYAGNIPAGNFISGANRFFNRSSLEILVRKRLFWNPAYLEDVAIGRVMSKFQVNPYVTDSITIAHPDALENVSDSEILGHYHFRVKCIENGVRKDHITMLKIQKRFENLRRNSSKS